MLFRNKVLKKEVEVMRVEMAGGWRNMNFEENYISLRCLRDIAIVRSSQPDEFSPDSYIDIKEQYIEY
jgi:hypothetical protein